MIGRPAINADIKVLVARMAAANPLWGAPRIHGELLKLGMDVSERTVSRLLPKRRTLPSQTWRTFLANHIPDMVALDFFTVPTVHLRVLFVLVVLAHDRRRVVHFNVTEHPTAQWTAQQIVEAFPNDAAPSYLLRDRDQIYGERFRSRVRGLGIAEILTTPQSPWQNPFVERLIGSVRRECLDVAARELTSRSTKTRPNTAQLSDLNSARWLRLLRSAVCIIAMPDGRPSLSSLIRPSIATPGSDQRVPGAASPSPTPRPYPWPASGGVYTLLSLVDIPVSTGRLNRLGRGFGEGQVTRCFAA